MQLCNHVDKVLVKCFKRWKSYVIYINDIRFGMWQVRENEISLRKWSGVTAQLRTLEETLIISKGREAQVSQAKKFMRNNRIFWENKKPNGEDTSFDRKIVESHSSRPSQTGRESNNYQCKGGSK